MDANLIGVIGMVGAAGCVGVGSTILRENYKEKETEKESADLSADESNEQELKENEKIVTSFPKDSMLIDKNKLKDILVQASYPAARVDEFVNLIATQAKTEAEKVVAEKIVPEPIKETSSKEKEEEKKSENKENKDGFVKVSFENLK